MSDTSTGAMSPMSCYRSHKKVRALKIASVEIEDDATTTEGSQLARIQFEDPAFEWRWIPLGGKPIPKPGWYLVQYDNGYVSFSPAKQFEEGYTLAETHFVAAARAAHEANRILCIALGDNSQPHWEDAPQWQRNAAMAGVALIRGNPDTTPEQLHESWLEQKREEGWKYGPVKNAETKEHPCFVSYADLPEQQRLKDAMFGLVVGAALA